LKIIVRFHLAQCS